jgi:hypothetical protein
MSDSVIEIGNPLLERWRKNARDLNRKHTASYVMFKRRSDFALFLTIALSLGVGCLNLIYGIGQTLGPATVPAVISGCLSLFSGSVAAISSGFEWQIKSVRHEDYSSRYAEVVRDINTEYTLRHLHDAEYASEGDFIRHMSTEMNRLEENAPMIPRTIEKTFCENSGGGPVPPAH